MKKKNSKRVRLILVAFVCAVLLYKSLEEVYARKDDFFDRFQEKETPTDETMITLCLMGDLMCLSGQQYTAQKKDGSYDFSESFSIIKDFLRSHDIVVGNLETLISKSTPISSIQKKVNDIPNCNGPEEFLKAVADAGFNGLVTANNHCLDGGITGVNETIVKLDEYGLNHCGTYEEESSADHFMMFEINSAKIAILSMTELINRRDSLKKGQLEQLVDCYSEEYAKELIHRAKKAGADYVIVYSHWGSENVHEVRDYQKEHAKELANAGADFIVGSHPHCLQEMEMITAKDGRMVPCFYSLGNLVSSMPREINNDAVLLSLMLEVTKEGIKLKQFSYLPCHVFRSFETYKNPIVYTEYTTKNKSDQLILKESEARIKKILSNVAITELY